MTNKKRELTQGDAFPEGFPPLLETLRDLIMQARQKVLSAANAAQVLTYWEIGRHIVEFEQGGEARATYGNTRVHSRFRLPWPLRSFRPPPFISR